MERRRPPDCMRPPVKFVQRTPPCGLHLYPVRVVSSRPMRRYPFMRWPSHHPRVVTRPAHRHSPYLLDLAVVAQSWGVATKHT